MTSPLSLLPRRPCDSRCGREGGEGESAFSCRPLGVFVCWGFRLLSPFWRQSAMQPGRHPGSEEGILGSCSVVRKIMSVPCGAVSGDRSQMQPLLYGRLSFSVENSLPPSQTSSKTFSRYCGSLRLKRGEKGGEKKAFLLPLPLSSSRRISLGCGGGHDRALPHPGDPGLPSRPRPPANKPPSTESLVQLFLSPASKRQERRSLTASGNSSPSSRHTTCIDTPVLPPPPPGNICAPRIRGQGAELSPPGALLPPRLKWVMLKGLLRAVAVLPSLPLLREAMHK
nr:uncharacterized protein LOC110365031 [Columba livia]